MREFDWSWLASLSIETVLVVAFFLVFIRLAFYGLRKPLGKAERTWGEMTESLLFAWVVVFLIIRPFVFEPFKIPSASMRNTLKEGDRIVVTKYSYRLSPPRRGDVVVFKSPPEALNNEVDFVKRLIGLPGDLIEIGAGQVFVNGEPLDEPYAVDATMPSRIDTTTDPVYPYRVPPDHYFMMGDNREQSMDSRFWGPLERSRIKGKAVAIFWPPSRVQRITTPEYSLPAGASNPPMEPASAP